MIEWGCEWIQNYWFWVCSVTLNLYFYEKRGMSMGRRDDYKENVRKFRERHVIDRMEEIPKTEAETGRWWCVWIMMALFWFGCSAICGFLFHWRALSIGLFVFGCLTVVVVLFGIVDGYRQRCLYRRDKDE